MKARYIFLSLLFVLIASCEGYPRERYTSCSVVEYPGQIMGDMDCE